MRENDVNASGKFPQDMLSDSLFPLTAVMRVLDVLTIAS